VTDGRGLSVRLEGDVALGELGQRPALNNVEVLTQYQGYASSRNLDLLVARSQDGYYVLRYAPPPALSMVARSEPAMLEVVGSYAEQAARMRGAASETPVRIGYSGEFSAGEIRAINASQELRAAAGAGGGWLPPTPPRSFWGPTSEPGRPNGFFFVRSAEADSERVGYAAHEEAGRELSLESVEPLKVGIARDILVKRVDWDKAAIKEIAPIGSLERAGMSQVCFEVELPVIDPPLLQRMHLTQRRPLLIRIINYFRRPPVAEQREAIKTAIQRVMKVNADANSVASDGMLAFKMELLREVKPDHLRFYVTYGDNDLQLVERVLPPQLHAHVFVSG
jgi:hypothetical protein